MALVFVTMATGTAVSLVKYWEAEVSAESAREQAGIAGEKAGEADREKAEALRQAGMARSNADEAKKQTQLALEREKESVRLLDLSRLREAGAAFDNNLVQVARDTLNDVAPENRCVAWRILNNKFDGSLFTLCGHTGPVTGVALSEDGTRVVTGSHDNTARVWDARTGQSLLELKGHTREVPWVALRADGKQVFTSDIKGVSIAWDIITGQRLEGVQPPSEAFNRPDRNTDGKYFWLPVGDRVERIPLKSEIDETERLRRLWLTRPDPDWHIERQKELAAAGNAFGAALQRSFEQHARGVLALEAGDTSQAFAHFIAAAILKPQPPEYGPMPRFVGQP